MSTLTIIAAVARNRVIGLNGALPWKIPEDMRRFKMLTTGHAVWADERARTLRGALEGKR